MEATGEGKRGVLFIAEAPGEDEDRLNKQLIGRAGQYLRKKLLSYGIDLDRDCRKINAVNCRPANNRTPTSEEINHCRPRVWAEIESFRPKMIILLGGPAVESFLGGRWMKDLGGISRWRGFTIPDRDVSAWVCPTFHPSYVQRSLKMDNKVVEVIFDQDLEQAFDKLREPMPNFLNEKSLVTREYNSRKIYNRLQSYIDWGQSIAFDYETTGLKPQAPGHRIVTCSISTSGMEAFAFPIPEDGVVRRKLCEVISSPFIPKRAHNMKFEDTWSKEILGVHVGNWEWDSMIAAHIIDNRSLSSGLKFQAYIHFGLCDYDSHIEPLLKSGENKVGNSFNRIHEIPMDDLLVYNGLDSLLEFRLSEIQMRMIK
jgi:uracil-DNA glycosylase family 4